MSTHFDSQATNPDQLDRRPPDAFDFEKAFRRQLGIGQDCALGALRQIGRIAIVRKVIGQHRLHLMAIPAEGLQDFGLIFPAENVISLKRHIIFPAGDALPPPLPLLSRCGAVEALPATPNGIA
jgi:hypothetical protein